MINVFIDTSIFVAEGYVKGKSIATLYEAAWEEKINILMPDITEYEIRKHLRMDVAMKSGRGVTGELKKSFMYAVDDLRPSIEKLMSVGIDALTVMVEDELDKQLKRANVEKLILSKEVDLSAILEDYKELKPPFSEKKKSEFPDAIALKQLEQWCKEHKDKCILLSNDPDLKSYKSECLEHRELTDFVASLEEYEKMITQDKLKAVFLSSKKVIEKKISDWMYDLYDDDVLYLNQLNIEDIHYSSINNLDIQLEDDLKWTGKGVGCLFYKTYANIVAEIEVGHPNYDTGYYDSEDKEWFFIDEKVVDYLEGRIRVPISIEYIYSTDEMVVDSINNDTEMSRSEVENTLIVVGQSQFFDEDDFDVDQEDCPHCGAKVMAFEHPGGVGNKEKEEIRCPRCHKVICERMTNGFFRTELMNS